MRATTLITSAALSIRTAERRLDRRDTALAIVDLREAQTSLDLAVRELEATIAALESPDDDTGVHEMPDFLRGHE